MARFTCPNCNTGLELPSGPLPEGGPRRVSCPHCGTKYALRRGDPPGARQPASPAGAQTVPQAGAAAGAARQAEGLAVPGSIGPYGITEVLGRGGMGVVYKARDSALDRWVAVKTLLPSLAGDPEARERFLREARAAAALNHPNVTQIYSIGEEGGTPYFAMEFIEGQTLAQKLGREERLQPLEAIRLVRQVALGLQEAQRIQLIHRDIKPANLILTPEGIVKITDFGLAKRAQGPASVGLTATGQAVGSPLYMSPEQARGGEVDHRSDIYSLGATFFHLLTGRPPFQAPSAMDVAMKHLQEPAPSPRSFAPGVSYPLAGLVQRMLRKRPQDRFTSYRALVDDLDRVEALERGGPPPEQVVPVWVRERRRGSWTSVVGFLALCLAAGLIGFRAARGALRGWARHEAARTEESAVRDQARPGEERGSAPAPGATRPTLRPGGRQRGGPAGERWAGEATPVGEARLEVLDLSQSPLPPNGLQVRGLVGNRGDAAARNVRVQVRVYDGAGALLGSQEVVPEGGPLEAGESAPFEAFFSEAGGAERVQAEISWMN